jgi:hypothetical protein
MAERESHGGIGDLLESTHATSTRYRAKVG